MAGLRRGGCAVVEQSAFVSFQRFGRGPVLTQHRGPGLDADGGIACVHTHAVFGSMFRVSSTTAAVKRRFLDCGLCVSERMGSKNMAFGTDGMQDVWCGV